MTLLDSPSFSCKPAGHQTVEISMVLGILPDCSNITPLDIDALDT